MLKQLSTSELEIILKNALTDQEKGLGKNNLEIEERTELSAGGVLDLAKLRLSQNFSDVGGVKKALLTIPVRKPSRQEFVRVHPSEDMCIQTAVLQLKEEGETYIVHPDLWTEIPGEIIPTSLATAITRQGVLFIWPHRLPSDDGKQNRWHQSALEAANMAKDQWIRIAANMSLGAYDVFVATGNLPDPEWPDVTFQKIMDIAFKDHFIQDTNHPVISRLRGEW